MRVLSVCVCGSVRESVCALFVSACVLYCQKVWSFVFVFVLCVYFFLRVYHCFESIQYTSVSKI